MGYHYRMLLLNNGDVARLLTIDDCIEVLDEAYREWGAGRAAQFPQEGRMDLVAPSPGAEQDRRFIWGGMAGVIPKLGIFTLRQKLDIHYQVSHGEGRATQEKFSTEPGRYCGFILIASTANAEPLAIVNDGVIQHLRVAATNALAARHLARDNASVLGLLGSGGMAASHVDALCGVRPVEEIRVYSPTAVHRERFAQETAARHGIRVHAVGSPEEAVRGADMVSFCTDSAVPVLRGTDWVEPGMHLSRVGPAEIGHAPERADVAILHQRGGLAEQVAGAEGVEAPRTLTHANGHSLFWERDRHELPTLAELLTGSVSGRTRDEQVTYFHSSPGNGIQFAAVAARLYQRAVSQEAGTQIPTEWFLQDIRD